MSLFDAIRYATSHDCEILFYDEPLWQCVSFDIRRRVDATGEGRSPIVRSYRGGASYKELISAKDPDMLMEYRLETATREVLRDS